MNVAFEVQPIALIISFSLKPGNAKGRPLGFVLTPGQSHDIQGFGPLFRMIADKIEALLADKGYDADASELRAGLARWFTYYNHHRPHSALAGRTPTEAYGQIGPSDHGGHASHDLMAKLAA